MNRLASLRAARRVVVTCYVRLGIEERIRSRYRTAVRDAMRAAETVLEQPGVPHDDRQQIGRDLRRIDDFLSNTSRLPHAPGFALFACESLSLFEVVPLPRALRTRVHIDDRPRIAELLATVDEFGRILVAAVDRTHARFFEVDAFGVSELSSLAPIATRGGKFHSDRADSPGWGEGSFHNRIREERHRQAADVMQEIRTRLGQGAWQGVVLAGTARTTAEQLRFLPRGLRPRVIGTARINPTSTTPAEIRRAALEARAAWERREEQTLVAELEEGIGQGWAVQGARGALRALHRGQVRMLLVAANQTGWGFRCADSGRLVLARADCRGEGPPIPVSDVVNEALEEALQQGAEVRVIDDPEAAGRLDGMAALLRFR
jgi:peptide subunit release factor 1 (eRF1)